MDNEVALPGDTLVGSCQLHVIGFRRVCDTATCQESAPEKCGFAAILLNNRKIDVQRQSILRRKAKSGHDMGNLIRLHDLKHQLTGRFHTREGIKGQIKCFFKQFGDNIGKFSAFRNNFNAIGGKMIAKQQNSEALCQCTAMLAGNGMACLCLCGGGKRHYQRNLPLSFCITRF